MKTEVELHMEYEPEDVKEKAGDVLGMVSRKVDGDLKRFKEFIETRRMETGGWRGSINAGEGTRTTGEMGGTGSERQSGSSNPQSGTSI